MSYERRLSLAKFNLFYFLSLSWILLHLNLDNGHSYGSFVGIFNYWNSRTATKLTFLFLFRYLLPRLWLANSFYSKNYKIKMLTWNSLQQYLKIRNCIFKTLMESYELIMEMDTKPSVFGGTLQLSHVCNSKVKNKTKLQLTGVLFQAQDSATACKNCWSGWNITFSILEKSKEVPLKSFRENMINWI